MSQWKRWPPDFEPHHEQRILVHDGFVVDVFEWDENKQEWFACYDEFTVASVPDVDDSLWMHPPEVELAA